MEISNGVNVLMHVSPLVLSDISETSTEQLHLNQVDSGVVDDSSSLFVHLIYNSADARSENWTCLIKKASLFNNSKLLIFVSKFASLL